MMNSELPVSNRTIHNLDLYNKQRMHRQRLYEIAVSGKRRADLGNSWQKSRPTYPHLRENLKRAQLQSERFDAIERENHILLQKMSSLMVGGSVLDPTEGTWEFRPGVRLNKFQMPVIDHGISHQPQMPQRGAAKEPESLNWGARRRELERITQENQGIVHRIQARESYYPHTSYQRRSADHDRHLLLIRRPNTSPASKLATPSSAGSSRYMSRLPSRPQSMQGARPLRRRDAAQDGGGVTSLLNDARSGDAHLLVGLTSGLQPGASLLIRPNDAAARETVEVQAVWLRKDGLVVLLRDPIERAHPVGSHVLLDTSPPPASA